MSSTDAMSKFPEMATAIGVTRELLKHADGNEFYETVTPERYVGWTFGDVATDLRHYGANLEYLVNMSLVPNPYITPLEKYGERVSWLFL